MTATRDSARPNGPGGPGAQEPGRPPLPSAGVPGSVRVTDSGSSSTRVVLAGEVDADLAAELFAVADAAASSGAPVEVDAGDVTFMDSTGVAFLARLASRTPSLTLRRPPEMVRFLLDVTAVGGLLTVVD